MSSKLLVLNLAEEPKLDKFTVDISSLSIFRTYFRLQGKSRQFEIHCKVCLTSLIDLMLEFILFVSKYFFM